MGILESFDEFAVFPRPTVESFILRTGDDCVGDGVVQDRDSVFMLVKFGKLLSLGNVPDDCLAVPRTRNEVIGIDEVE